MTNLKIEIDKEIDNLKNHFNLAFVGLIVSVCLTCLVSQVIIFRYELEHFSVEGLIIFIFFSLVFISIVYNVIRMKKKNRMILDRLNGYLGNEEIMDEWGKSSSIYKSDYINAYESENYIYLFDSIHHVGIQIFSKDSISEVRLIKERNWGSRYSYTHYMWLLNIKSTGRTEYSGLFSFRYNAEKIYDEEFHDFAKYLGSFADEYVENIEHRT